MPLVNPRPLKLVTNSQAELRFKRYLEERCMGIRRGLEKLHGQDGIIKWRKAYEAVPAQPERSFPWANASNLVVPIVAIHSDTLLARAMSAVWKTRPIWVVRELGEFAKSAPEGLRRSLEDFLEYVALEPSELNLYPEYEQWIGEAIRLGTSVMKTPWVHEVEDYLGPAGDLQSDEWLQKVVYDGPRPRKLKFENFKCPVNVGSIEEMDFKFDITQLNRTTLEERAFRKIYDYMAVQRVLQQPDRTSNVGQVQAAKEQDAKVQTVPGYGFAEWDIAECHFSYRYDDKHFVKVIAWYHEKSKQVLRSYFAYYPDEIYTAARLFFRDDMFHGMGFAEILLPFQEEISEIHNDRRNNMSIANMKLFAVDPNSPLHKGFKIYPSAMLPAKQINGQKEIEALDMGTPVQGEIDSERLSLELAEKRSGVSPPMQGYGAGTNTKRGVYTAMGTLSLLQEGNTRTDLNISDIRFAHTKLGRLLCREYGSFGVNEDLLAKFGELAPKIEEGIKAIAEGKMALPVYASTASVNREVEKQSDMMMMGIMERYRQGILSLMAQIPMMPPDVQKQAVKELEASHLLMQQTLRHFGHDEVDRLAPKPEIQAQGAGQPNAGQPQPGGQPQGQGGPPALSPMSPQELIGMPPMGGRQ